MMLLHVQCTYKSRFIVTLQCSAHKWRVMSEHYRILMWRCHNLFQLLSLWPWQPSRTQQTKLQTEVLKIPCWLTFKNYSERFDSFWKNPLIISFCLIDQSSSLLIHWYSRLIDIKLAVWQDQPWTKFKRRHWPAKIIKSHHWHQKYMEDSW